MAISVSTPPVVLVHFHPDWPYRGGTVVEAIVADRRYRSQFETGTSNGGLTAQRGGDRWRWETELFDGKYDAVEPNRRPIYGALDLGDRYGAAPRFGSAHLRLRPEIALRSTFCYPDSVFQPGGVVGADGLGPLVEQMHADDVDVLDRYVEAHVHGGVNVEEDVEAIVLDPCFRETSVSAAAESSGCNVEFHPGYSVSTAELDPEYRGPEYVAAARSLGTKLTPDLVGAAAVAGIHDAQSLKRIWHLLARFGRLDEK